MEVAAKPPDASEQTNPAGGLGDAIGLGDGVGVGLGVGIGLGEGSSLGDTVGVDPGLRDALGLGTAPHAVSRPAMQTAVNSFRIRRSCDGRTRAARADRPHELQPFYRWTTRCGWWSPRDATFSTGRSPLPARH